VMMMNDSARVGGHSPPPPPPKAGPGPAPEGDRARPGTSISRLANAR
jgi:hypothetical protein